MDVHAGGGGGHAHAGGGGHAHVGGGGHSASFEVPRTKQLFLDPASTPGAPSRVRSISGVQFGMFSGPEMMRMAHIAISNNDLYTMPPHREAVAFGVQDPRLGVSKGSGGKFAKCGTCERLPELCPGHWGVITLELPVFHIGFLKATINVLQNICKTCSRVLLKPEERRRLLKRMRAPATDALLRTKLRRKITEITKKCAICPWCGALNGSVKKVNVTECFRLLHDRYKLAKPAAKEKARAAFLGMIDASARTAVPGLAYDASLLSNAKQRAFEVLSPVRALELFKAVPDADLDLLWMDRALGRPEVMITTHVLVPPVAIRPSTDMETTGGSNEDDLTTTVAQIVHSNKALKKALESGRQAQHVQDVWDWVQKQTATLVNGDVPGFPPNKRPKRPIRGLAQRLKGKQGRFRGNLSGKRVDFSGRTVISPDPNLRLHEVGVPEKVAKIMTYPERVTRYNLAWLRRAVANGNDAYPGAYAVRPVSGPPKSLRTPTGGGGRDLSQYLAKTAAELKVGDLVERHMVNGDVVLFNRQPSLHKMSIMSHRARVLPGRTFRFNECVCTPYNADFDGDEMNLHLPQTEEARTESAVLMDVRDNMINSRSGEPLIAAHQDFITAAYLLTQRDVFLDRDAFCLAVAQLSDACEEVVLPPPAVLKPGPFWTGKQVINVLLRPRPSVLVSATFEVPLKSLTKNYGVMCPADGYVVVRDGELLAGNLDKSVVGGGSKSGLVYVLIRENAGRTSARALHRLTKLSSRWLSNWGFSIGLEDVSPSERLTSKKAAEVTRAYADCRGFIDQFNRGKLAVDAGMTMEQSLESRVDKTLSDMRKTLGDLCQSEMPRLNCARVMATSGSKGSWLNISQMVASVGSQQVGGTRIQDGFVNRTLPIFTLHDKSPDAKGFVSDSFYSGLSATEFFFHTMAGREGLVDTAVKTADTGYLQRRMMKSLEDLSVQYDNTVRTSSTDVVQFAYGDDGLDPSFMEARETTKAPATFSWLPEGYVVAGKDSDAGGPPAMPVDLRRCFVEAGTPTSMEKLRAVRAAAGGALPKGAEGALRVVGGANERAQRAGAADAKARRAARSVASARAALEAGSKSDAGALEAALMALREAERALVLAARVPTAAAAPPGFVAATFAGLDEGAPCLTGPQIRELALLLLSGPRARHTLHLTAGAIRRVAARALGGHVALGIPAGGDSGAGAATIVDSLAVAGEGFLTTVCRFIDAHVAGKRERKVRALRAALTGEPLPPPPEVAPAPDAAGRARAPESVALARTPLLVVPDEAMPAGRVASTAVFEGKGGAADLAVLAARSAGITAAQLIHVVDTLLARYAKAGVQPGEAVGAVAAHSLGEPATQMTLKTFHFAGVASMNVTLGVPRIKEVMNASKNISTPIIEAPLDEPLKEMQARLVKGRIEKTTLGDVARHIAEVYEHDAGAAGGAGGRRGGGSMGTPGAYLEVVLDLDAIQQLQLDDVVTVERIMEKLVKTPKLHLKPQNITLRGRDTLLIRPAARKAASRIRAERQRARDVAKEKERAVVMPEPAASSGGGGGGGGGGGARSGGAGASDDVARVRELKLQSRAIVGGAGGAFSSSSEGGESTDDEATAATAAKKRGSKKKSWLEEAEEDASEAEEAPAAAPEAAAKRRASGRGHPVADDEPCADYVAKVLMPSGGGNGASSVRDDTYYSLQALKQTLPLVIVAGIEKVSRAVISKYEVRRERDRVDDGSEDNLWAAYPELDPARKEKKADEAVVVPAYMLHVEGYNLLQVMGVQGVRANACKTNHVTETAEVLGIEAARSLIMSELKNTQSQYAINVDFRHTQLLADVMTYRGAVLGITRFGIAKMKDSVLMLASFEKTPDHLFDAAVHARGDTCRGVSESIIVGTPIPLGTGMFKLLTPPVQAPPEGGAADGPPFSAPPAAAATAAADMLDAAASPTIAAPPPAAPGRKVSFAPLAEKSTPRTAGGSLGSVCERGAGTPAPSLAQSNTAAALAEAIARSRSDASRKGAAHAGASPFRAAPTSRSGDTVYFPLLPSL